MNNKTFQAKFPDPLAEGAKGITSEKAIAPQQDASQQFEKLRIAADAARAMLQQGNKMKPLQTRVELLSQELARMHVTIQQKIAHGLDVRADSDQICIVREKFLSALDNLENTK